MQRRFVSWGLMLLSALGSVSLMRAIADNFDPAEKRCAQNLYRLGRAALMYSQDYDEQFPMAYERFANTQPWGWDAPVAVPRNWQTGSPHGGWTWANALQPYLWGNKQSYAFLSCPSTLPYKLPGADYSQRVQSPVPVSYTYNGYLHNYFEAGVDDPSTLPLFWEGLGREHWLGFAPVNPILRCDRADQPCRFTPCTNPSTHYPRGEVRLPQQSVWIHKSGMHFITMELKLQVRRLGARIAPNSTDPRIDPFDGYNTQGIPSVARTDACGYLPLFAPR
ncbi:MAG: hypothetical protein WHS44_08550 [Fimbriimonadales bacterium]|nr:MAG: hypothetical protein KatS3mg018_1566 [Fimbriimonadales bacterium]